MSAWPLDYGERLSGAACSLCACRPGCWAVDPPGAPGLWRWPTPARCAASRRRSRAGPPLSRGCRIQSRSPASSRRFSLQGKEGVDVD